MSEEKHKRLSDALCEAVEFGTPTAIKMGDSDFVALLSGLDAGSLHKVSFENPTFEGVPVKIEHDRRGCVVEHDNRYSGIFIGEVAGAIPETVALDRKTRKPVIVAW